MSGTGKYGWCLTGHHTTCPHQTQDHNPCTCDCHRHGLDQFQPREAM